MFGNKIWRFGQENVTITMGLKFDLYIFWPFVQDNVHLNSGIQGLQKLWNNEVGNKKIQHPTTRFDDHKMIRSLYI